MQTFHKEVFWIYGVIVALAIREALIGTLHHLFFPAEVPSWQLHLEAFRTVLCLLVIVRFYFGSLTFFHETYIDPERSAEVSDKSYGLDFFMGLTHFIILFAWSVTIPSHAPRKYFGLSNFLIVLGLVLVFDVVWLVFNSGFDTKKRLKLWTVINLVTLGLAYLAFVVTYIASDNATNAEYMAMVIVAAISCLELFGMLSQRRIFAEWIESLVR